MTRVLEIWRDKPIIFSAPMVRALLDGRKTQTRRIIRPEPFVDRLGNFCAPDRKGKLWNWGQNVDGTPCLRNFVRMRIRFAAGDRLWVRETWSHSGVGVWTISTARMCGRGGVVYRADRDQPGAHYWPSIHMPREFSRLTLIVSDVRVQRLQDITEEDAVAEGVQPLDGQFDGCFVVGPVMSGTNARDCFSRLWNSLHGSEAWAANPWVVAPTFTVEQRNIDALREAA